MSKSKQVKNYNRTARLLHWLSAFVIIFMFAAGWWMMSLTYYSKWYMIVPFWHKSIGIVFAGLTLYRLVWKLFRPAPKVEGQVYEVLIARAVHSAMYALLFIQFVSGYLISTSDGRSIDVFGWFMIPGAGELFSNQSDIAGQVHYYVALTLIGLALVHAVAALKHHFIDKDNTLKKMMGKVK